MKSIKYHNYYLKFLQSFKKDGLVLILDLYNYWQSLEHNFTDTEFVTYVLKYGLNLKNIQIVRYPINTGEDAKKDLLYHPTRFINSQWVFIPQDKDYRRFQQYLSQSLLSL